MLGSWSFYLLTHVKVLNKDHTEIQEKPGVQWVKNLAYSLFSAVNWFCVWQIRETSYLELDLVSR